MLLLKRSEKCWCGRWNGTPGEILSFHSVVSPLPSFLALVLGWTSGIIMFWQPRGNLLPDFLLFWDEQAWVVSGAKLTVWWACSIDAWFLAVSAGFFFISGIPNWSNSLGHHTFQNKEKRLQLLCIWPDLKPYQKDLGPQKNTDSRGELFDNFVCFLVAQGLELRVACLLGRCATTWTTPVTQRWSLIISKISWLRLLVLFLGGGVGVGCLLGILGSFSQFLFSLCLFFFIPSFFSFLIFTDKFQQILIENLLYI
jgi:hypothetical protein